MQGIAVGRLPPGTSTQWARSRASKDRRGSRCASHRLRWTCWSIGGADISSGKSSLRLDSDRAGQGAITVTLTATCDTSGAQQIPSDQPGMRRFEHPLSLVPRFTGLRFYTFPGGCVTYRFSFAPGASPSLAGAADSALSFRPRAELVDFVSRTEGLALCGRGAACPG